MRSTDPKPANPTCATCRHEVVRGLPFLPFIKSQWCGHPLALDRVTGRADTPCALMRGSPAGRGDPKALCGAQGRNWEAREPERTLGSLWPEGAMDIIREGAPLTLAEVREVPGVKSSHVDPVTTIVQRMKPR